MKTENRQFMTDEELKKLIKEVLQREMTQEEKERYEKALEVARKAYPFAEG